MLKILQLLAMHRVMKSEKTSKEVPDDGEVQTLMEPLLVGQSSKHYGKLADLAIELTNKSARFRGGLSDGVLKAAADLVRAVNCYYSSLIEGNDTHPIDIERALTDDYNKDDRKRNLQLEAVAHITVQKWIDEGKLKGCATTQKGIIEVHRRFGDLLPEELLWVENPETRETVKMVPGELRERYVKIGRHVPISPGALPRFVARFEAAYKTLGEQT